MIKLENVTKVYKTGVRAVNNMNVDIGDGEFVYVIGPTGAGKSRLQKLSLYFLGLLFNQILNCADFVGFFCVFVFF